MDGGKEERIIAGANYQDDTVRDSLHLEGNARHPKRASSFSRASRREHAGRASLQPTTSINQWENFGNEIDASVRLV